MATGRSQKSRDTQAELKVCAALRARGLTGFITQETISLPRWAGKNQRTTPDVLFKDEMLAVFVDGCAWHGCPKHFVDYGTNTAYWRKKRAQQRARDQRHSRCLETLGYRVLRIWECEDAVAGARAAEAIIDTEQPPGTFGLPE